MQGFIAENLWAKLDAHSGQPASGQAEPVTPVTVLAIARIAGLSEIGIDRILCVITIKRCRDQSGDMVISLCAVHPLYVIWYILGRVIDARMIIGLAGLPVAVAQVETIILITTLSHAGGDGVGGVEGPGAFAGVPQRGGEGGDPFCSVRLTQIKGLVDMQADIRNPALPIAGARPDASRDNASGCFPIPSLVSRISVSQPARARAMRSFQQVIRQFLQGSGVASLGSHQGR